MSAYSREIGDGTSKWSNAMQCAHLFGITILVQMPHPATRNVSCAARQARIHAKPRNTTHTDPQILFWATTP
jgi:hypothetical protein